MLRENKNHKNPQSLVTLYQHQVGWRAQPASICYSIVLHPYVLNVLLLHSKALARCCESTLLSLLNIWACKKVQHLLALWQPGVNEVPLHDLDLGVFIYKSDGYPMFQHNPGVDFCPEAGTNAHPHATHLVYQPTVCSRKRREAAAVTQHHQIPWDTSRLGFVRRSNCSAAAPVSVFPPPSL